MSEEKNMALVKMQGFWEKFQKPILTIAAVLVIGIGGYYGYRELVVKPKEDKAQDAVYRAQEYFNIDSSNLVLNGDGQSRGVLYVLKNFDGTKAANLCKFYAGVSYLKLGDFNNAVKYLKDFSTDAKQIQLKAYGCLGDAYAELNKKDEALESYKKAATVFDTDDANSAEYLYRAALLAATMGKDKEALDLFTDLKDKFPKTDKGFLAAKYINRISVDKN